MEQQGVSLKTLICIILYLFGSYIFYKGFLPNSNSNKSYSRFPEDEKNVLLQEKQQNDRKLSNPISPKYDRLVLVLIDAMRADFVFTTKTSNKYMPFLQNKIINNETFSYVSVGNSPTVTMPRIKGITSGSIPNFHDVLLNSVTSKFTEDNIISRFHENGLNMTFFGDDTWLKLFPNYFIRSDGTQSFYVTDYTEVDDNVTRHLSDEFNKDDWNIMILHYLGLDHIGHTVGPFSPLISHKLLEMDRIIEGIFKNMTKHDKIHGTNSILLITGDHGMSNAGSHGGASKEEINTPIIFLRDPDYHGESFEQKIVKQTDIAVTLAILLGIGIPENSIGRPMPFIQHLYNDTDVKNILRYVSCHLHNVADQKVNNEDLQSLKDICSGISKDKGDIHKVSKILGSLSSEYNNNYMIVGLFIMLITTTTTGAFLAKPLMNIEGESKIQYPNCNNFSFIFAVITMLIFLISLASSSFVEEEHYLYYFFVTSYFIGLLVINSKLFDFKDVFFVLILLRVIRGWNRTGVKWSGLEDIEDYLNQHNIILIILISITLLSVVILLGLKDRSYINLCIIGILSIGVLVFKNCMCQLSQDFKCSKTLTLYSARIVYTFIIIQTLIGNFMSKSIKTAWIFLCLLLLRTTNFPMFCLMVLVEYVISERLVSKFHSIGKLNTLDLFYIYFGLSRFSHFCQGNSNNFATVDISAGVIGLTEYNPVLSTLISFFATYCSKIFWYFSLHKHMKSYQQSSNINLILCSYQMIESTFFCFIVYTMRYHLFIWSVFAPKYLYMMAESLLNFFIVYPLLYFT